MGRSFPQTSVVATVFAAVVMSVTGLGTSAGEAVRGIAVVIDGQTLEIGGRRVTLEGILAPPLAMDCETRRGKPYPCGGLARQALSDIVEGKPLSCTVAATAKAGVPPLAVCQLGPFLLSELVISTGRVMARPGVSERYDKAARAAQLLGEGLWKGRFPPPETWRAAP